MKKTNFVNEIPVIDVSSLLREDYKPNQASKEMGEACENIGFFYVSNHGISLQDQRNALKQAREFFASSLEQKDLVSTENHPFYSGYVPFKGEKTKGKVDSHEAFDIIRDSPLSSSSVIEDHPTRGQNLWPDWMKSFKPTMLKHWNGMENLGNSITKGIFLSLGLEEALMNDYMRDPISELRMIYYPETNQEEQGIGAHKDYGFVTMVLQDREGIEVKPRQGDWIKAENIEDLFLVNIGYMVQVWTNDLYPATEHRVMTSKQDRTSVIFFTGPSPHVEVAPLESLCSQDNPPKYNPFNYGKYVTKKLSQSYG